MIIWVNYGKRYTRRGGYDVVNTDKNTLSGGILSPGFFAFISRMKPQTTVIAKIAVAHTREYSRSIGVFAIIANATTVKSTSAAIHPP